MPKALRARSSPFWAVWAFWKSPPTARRQRSLPERAKERKSASFWVRQQPQARRNFRLRIFRFGMGVALHLDRPFQKAPQLSALAPHKLPEFQEADLLHLDAGVGLDAPQ